MFQNTPYFVELLKSDNNLFHILINGSKLILRIRSILWNPKVVINNVQNL